MTHEYGHGISHRLVGGPANANSLDNQDQPGEGWSDYLALMMTMEGRGSRHRTTAWTPTWSVTHLRAGIRPGQYSTNLAVNSLTLPPPTTARYCPVLMAWAPCGAAALWDMTWARSPSMASTQTSTTATAGTISHCNW
ncbi:MAG: M36 family metallopeptidase [Flavobacteriales bacterium]|nr:M36 family metallopeptidase [Flavobacteriales bacterium]